MSSLATRPANAGQITKAAQNSRYANEDEDDVLLPRIHIYQGLPAEAKQFGRGFEPGDLINTLTNEKVGSRRFTPIFGYNQWIKWNEPRGSGMEYSTREKAQVPAADMNWDDAGNPPAAQKYMNFVVLFEGTDTPCILSFSRTAIGAGKTLNTLEKMRGQRGPGLYELTTKEKSNDKGAWLVPQIRPVGDPAKKLAEQATALFASLNTAAVTTNLDGEDDPDAIR